VNLAKKFAWFVSIAMAVAGARAFAFGELNDGGKAIQEYYNVYTGHYSLAYGEIDGPGWIRTGHVFGLDYGNFDNCSAPSCPHPVYRFSGTPGLGPDSNFFTANPDEAEILKQPGTGWTFDEIAFYAPVPDPATGQCGVTPPLTKPFPVFRLYNNRWMYNDSNHRYTASAAIRDRMVARGWSYEGIAFCARNYTDLNLTNTHIFSFNADPATIKSAVDCEGENALVGRCLSVSNLPVPTYLALEVPVNASIVLSDPYFQTTDVYGTVYAIDSSAPADNAFVQPDPPYLGISLNTSKRSASPYTSINPVINLPTQTTTVSGEDPRLFPFRDGVANTLLQVEIAADVKTLDLAGAHSQAYGHAIIGFVDATSGKRFDLAVYAYGTVPPADFTMVDVKTGRLMVVTSFRPGSPYGTNAYSSTRPTDGLFMPLTPFMNEPHWNQWAWSMRRDQLQNAIDAARTADPTFSGEPEDYFIGQAKFSNEIFGDGKVGMNIVELLLKTYVP
jgi:hypothetical protein